MEDTKNNENKPTMNEALTEALRIDDLEIIELAARRSPNGGPLFPNHHCRPPQ